MPDRHDPIDWEEIERSPAFRELVTSRRRFVATVGGAAIGVTVAYVLIAYLAADVLAGAEPITIGFIAGVGLIVMTWVVTLMYLRKSDREWGPLERRIAEQARVTEPSGRFAREPEGAREEATS
jgi:uncharacterized membrane protein (DUF485 family)